MDEVRIEYQKMLVFEQTCLIYGGDIQRFIYTMTRNDQYAMEEIYQNTMLGALRGLNYLRDIEKMKPWIFSIARAESKRYYAANRPRNYDCIITSEKDAAGMEAVIDFTKSIEDKEYVKSLIQGLTEEEQQLTILHYYFDLPLKEISEILNVNYNTVRSMHIRGMAKLRKIMQ